jgi:threonine dehydratase
MSSTATSRSAPTAEELHADVVAAAARIGPSVSRTDCTRLPWLDAPGREVWAKLECHQRTGSFKVRGALNALLDGSDRPVVTASAGNHALAISAAAAQAGRDCTIFVPGNASPLKVERLTAGGTRVKQAGRDLHAAARLAAAEADRTGARYVSAYGDRDVIAGQGTCAIETLEQVGAVDAVLVPLGGGGLITGVGAYLAGAAPRTRVIGVHPAIYGRRLTPQRVASALMDPIVPSLADGLSVQVTDRESGFTALAESLIDDVLECDERTIQLAICALLERESILAEGAGAIGVGALLSDPRGERISGRVVVVVSGGNVTAAHVSEAMAVAVDDPQLRTVLGLRGVRLSSELDRDDATPPAVSAAVDRDDGATRGDDSAAAVRDRVWRAVGANAVADLDELAVELDHHAGLAARLGLDADPVLQDAVRAQLATCDDLARALRDTPHGDPRLARRARALLHAGANARLLLEWCSPSSDESRAVQFFDLATRSTAVPYSRYGFPGLQELEHRLVEALGLDPARVAICATSSGMAAFQVVEAFLTREVLAPGDAVLYAPYIYFEASEHFCALPHLRHVHAESYDAAALARQAEDADARVVFADPVANIRDMPALDLRALGEHARGGRWSRRWLVIDGTMVSGGLDPFAWFDPVAGPRVIYYESASKYLQLGTDMQMAGVVAAGPQVVARLHRHRRNTGATLYEQAALRFPRFQRAEYSARNGLLCRNAELFAASLEREFAAPRPFAIGYPRAWRELGWGHGGGVVSVVFAEQGLNNRLRLEGLIEIVLDECRRTGVRLTKGVSFGFSTARLSASAALAQETDPFLRISLGEEDRGDVIALARATAAAIRRFRPARS